MKNLWKIKEYSKNVRVERRSWGDCQENNSDGWYFDNETVWFYSVYYNNKHIKTFEMRENAKEFIKHKTSISKIDKYIDSINAEYKKEIVKLLKTIKANELERKQLKYKLKKYTII